MTGFTDVPTDLPADSRYHRPRLTKLVSWTGLIMGVVVGAALALTYTWVFDPRTLVDIHPRQMETNARSEYIAAVAVSFTHNSDLELATDRLLTVVPPGKDPFQEVADVACLLAQTGYVSSSSGIEAVRAMKTFYQLQQRSGCADDIVLVAAEPTAIVTVVLPTSTPLPPPTKTATVAPTKEATPTIAVFIPTAQPLEEYVLINVATFCDVARSGLIEVFVQDFNGTGIPGEPVRVRWDGGEDVFFTGLKPERSPAYADFEMTADVAYIIDMPDRSEPSTRELVAAPCTTEVGDRAITSYRATFRPLE